jgi:serine/threonine protein kinase
MAEYSLDSIIQGRYQVIQALSGGMGIVYICIDKEENGFPVALKTLQDRFFSDVTIRERFLREASVWVQIGYHPNIVQAYKVIHLADQSAFIVLQLIPRLPSAKDASLRSLLIPNSPLPTDRALKIVVEICKGMAYATSRFPNLVHRDLKPENILIGPDGSARITDFGLVKIMESAYYENNKKSRIVLSNHFQTTLGTVGTPLYMSPEQWTGGIVDARSDIYAVGLILFEMLSGFLPIQSHSIDEIAQSHLAGVPLLKLQSSCLDPVLKQLLQEILQPDSSSRIPDWETAIRMISQSYSLLFNNELFLEDPPLDVARSSVLNKAESFLAVGASYVDIGQFALADHYSSLAMDIAKSENHLPLLALAFGNQAVANAGMGNNKPAISLYANAIKIYLQLGLVQQAANDLANMGNSYFLCGDKKEARNCLVKALGFFTEARNKNNIARCQANIANIDISEGDYQAALTAFMTAKEVARNSNDVQGEAKYLGGVALAQEGLGDNQGAIKSYFLALEKAKAIADYQAVASALMGAGNLLGQSGDASRGIQLLEEGLAISVKIGDQLGQSIATGNLGVIFLKMMSFEKAQKFLEESLGLAKGIGARSVLANAHWALGLLNEVKKDFNQAIMHQREAVLLYKELNDPSYERNSKHLISLGKEIGLF